MSIVSIFDAWKDFSFEKALGFSLTIIALLAISKIFPKSESETKTENIAKIIKLILVTMVMIFIIVTDCGKYFTLFFQFFANPIVNTLTTLPT